MSVGKKFFFSLSFFFVTNYAYSQDNSPASPSSSYNNEYFSKDEKIIENRSIAIEKKTQIIVEVH